MFCSWIKRRRRSCWTSKPLFQSELKNLVVEAHKYVLKQIRKIMKEVRGEIYPISTFTRLENQINEINLHPLSISVIPFYGSRNQNLYNQPLSLYYAPSKLRYIFIIHLKIMWCLIHFFKNGCTVVMENQIKAIAYFVVRVGKKSRLRAF